MIIKILLESLSKYELQYRLVEGGDMWILWLLGGLGGYFIYGDWKGFMAGFLATIVITILIPLILVLICSGKAALNSNSVTSNGKWILVGIAVIIIFILITYSNKYSAYQHTSSLSNTVAALQPSSQLQPSTSKPSLMVADAQRILTKLGYTPGPIDGKPGPRTEEALATFQRNMGLSPEAGNMVNTIPLLIRADAVAADISNDYIPNTCSNYSDPIIYGICEHARVNQVPFGVAFEITMLSEMEYAANVCGFSLNENYYLHKEKLMYINKANNFFSYMSKYYATYKIELGSQWGMKQNFCNYHYSNFGPNAPRGPSGGDNRFFR